MIFVDSKLANGPVISPTQSLRKAEGTTHACQLVHPVNVDHLKIPIFPNRINGDDGLFTADMLGRAGGTALSTMKSEVTDTAKIYTSELS